MLKILACIALVTLGLAVSADAQSALTSAPAEVKRITLQRVDVPNSNYEVIFDTMEISPGKVARRHSNS